MSFRAGTVSYARYRVIGGPEAPDPGIPEALADHVLVDGAPAAGPGNDPRGNDPRGDGTGPRPEYESGWVAGAHLLDLDFSSERIFIADAAVFGLRIDVHRVPGELRRAYIMEAEAQRRMARPHAAEGAPLGGRERREAREEAAARCRAELATGRHRRSRVIPVLWFLSRRLLLAPAFADAQDEALRALFETTFGAPLERLSAGRDAWLRFSERGGGRLIEDLRPTGFSTPPPGAGESADPTVPWASGGPEPHDFLGNEFLLWLWHHAIADEGLVETPSGTIALAMQRSLESACAWDVGGRIAITADAPGRQPEAHAALRAGKLPRRMGLMIAHRGEGWSLTLQGDRMAVSAATLPRPEERPGSEREDLEGRVRSIDALDRAVQGLYHAFLDVRTAGGWTGERDRLRAWIRSGGGSAAPVRGHAGPSAGPDGAERRSGTGAMIEITTPADGVLAGG